MFINEIITNPVIVEGRTFVERTINSEFKKGKATITTTYMDGKPLLKQYIFSDETKMKNIWKDVLKKKRTGYSVENKLDVRV